VGGGEKVEKAMKEVGAAGEGLAGGGPAVGARK
jgi:hypothetical protein